MGSPKTKLAKTDKAYQEDPTSDIITRSITAGLSILDRDFRIVWYNKTQSSWFGPLEKNRGKYCYEIYEKRSKVCHGCPTKKIFKYGMDECVSLRRNIFVEGKGIRHFRITSTPIKDVKNRIIQVLELVEDVTDEINTDTQVKNKLSVVSKELDFISKLDRRFIYSEKNSLDTVLNQAIEIAPTLLNSKICNLRLLDTSSRLLIPRATIGLDKKYAENGILELGAGIAGRVAKTKKPVLVGDILSKHEVKLKNALRKQGIRSLVCVPIVLNQNVLGTITVYDKKINGFTKQDTALLLNFANHVAILIDNIKIHKRVFVAYVNTIKSLVSAVEARDAYTSGHSEKVTKYSLDIANVMNLPKPERVMLAYCGRLHDIGKIATSDLILNKRGSLTATEMAEIQRHPARGVEILANLEFLEPGIPAIKYHHERYDGKGYPEGIKGKDIPILARIITCADSFDAMTSDRAYRPRMEFSDAINEIKNNKKKQFDPDIADIFVEILEGKKHVFNT